MIDDINQLLNSNNYDVRVSRDARYMDQKVTPDVLCLIADCVINFNAKYPNQSFTKDDIWKLPYFNNLVREIFNKPDAQNETTTSEYDKITSQPLRTLAYSGVLNMTKESRRNVYRIVEPDILEFIAFKNRNAYQFLYKYIIKVLTDSAIIRYFEEYKDKFNRGNLTQDDFVTLKNRFQIFMIGNTAINGTLEVNRIFPKILNVYACENSIPGSIKGRISSHSFYYTDLMYNRPNWRDINKSKSISRQEHMQKHEDLLVSQRPAYSKYIVKKMSNLVSKLHTESEVNDEFANGEATQVHHIFPSSEFPDLAHRIENMIKLTPTQHYTKAHPSNNTQEINKDYQCVCLIAKSESIEKHLNSDKYDYCKKRFIDVINKGLNESLNTELDFRSIRKEITRIYNSL